MVLPTDLAITVNRARTDVLPGRPYCLSSVGVECEYKRTGREEQGQEECYFARVETGLAIPLPEQWASKCLVHLVT